EGGGVEVVLEALADGLEDDGEVGVVDRDAEQLGGAVALLPQRLTAVGPAARQEQGPGGGLPEAGGEVRRAGEGLDDLPGELVGVEEEVLGAHRQLAALAADVRQTEHDAVVGGHGGDVHPELLPEPGGEHERPRGVDPRAEGGVDDDAPVAELVAEAFDDEGAVVAEAGVVPLLVEVPEEVVAGPLVQALLGEAGVRLLEREGGGGADERAERPSELDRPAGRVALPEGQPSGLPGSG